MIIIQTRVKIAQIRFARIGITLSTTPLPQRRCHQSQRGCRQSTRDCHYSLRGCEQTSRYVANIKGTILTYVDNDYDQCRKLVLFVVNCTRDIFIAFRL